MAKATKLYGTKIRLAIPDSLARRVKRVLRLRAIRLDFDSPASEIFREALLIGIAEIERAEDGRRGEVPDGEGEARAAR